jgi:hypothetical protein
LWCWNFEITNIKQLQQFLTWGVWDCTTSRRMLSIQIACQYTFMPKA